MLPCCLSTVSHVAWSIYNKLFDQKSIYHKWIIFLMNNLSPYTYCEFSQRVQSINNNISLKFKSFSFKMFFYCWVQCTLNCRKKYFPKRSLTRKKRPQISQNQNFDKYKYKRDKVNFNPFHATDPLLYPWTHHKTRDFLIFSGGIQRDQWHETG